MEQMANTSEGVSGPAEGDWLRLSRMDVIPNSQPDPEMEEGHMAPEVSVGVHNDTPPATTTVTLAVPAVAFEDDHGDDSPSFLRSNGGLDNLVDEVVCSLGAFGDATPSDRQANNETVTPPNRTSVVHIEQLCPIASSPVEAVSRDGLVLSTPPT